MAEQKLSDRLIWQVDGTLKMMLFVTPETDDAYAIFFERIERIYRQWEKVTSKKKRTAELTGATVAGLVLDWLGCGWLESSDLSAIRNIIAGWCETRLA